ncbi:MAG: ABATE domain-containing protein [Streptosporangiaceae bacterium]
MPDTSGPLYLIQSFANTLGPGPDVDLLRTREEAAGWLRSAALLPDDAGLSNGEHAALLRLREAIRDVLVTHANGRQDAPSATRLTRALADGRLILTVDPGSAVELASAARASYPNLVALVAIAVAQAAASGGWLRLKLCPAPNCGRAFHDESGSGRCARHAAG